MFIMSCDPAVENDVVVVNGFVVGVKDIVHVEVKRFQSGDKTAVADADVELVLDGTAIPLSHQGEGIYSAQLPDGSVIPGYQADINVNANRRISAKATVPPAITITSHTSTTFNVSSSNSAQEVFAMNWTNRDGFSYLLQLENLESSPVAIEFFDNPIRFEQVYAGPIEESAITLFAGDFTYYGSHRLTVYVVPEEYRDLFFFQNSGLGELVVQGPDNVRGGFGSWNAINAEEIILTVLP